MKEHSVISDPVLHAKEKYEENFFTAETVLPWQAYASFCTTGQFARLENGFVRHCGPTAITNLVLMLRARFPESAKAASPEEIFLQSAAIGKRLFIYHNMDLFHLYGGTNNLLAGIYIEKCLQSFGFPCRILNYFGSQSTVHGGRLRLIRRIPANPATMEQELRKGRLLYLMLHHHRCYGSHHVICSGFRVLKSSSSEREERYFLIADGWSSSPRYLAASELGFCSYCSVF